MKTLLLAFISFYQKWVSGLKHPSCKFYPTCSSYTKEAITKYGSVKGSYLGIKRILRCHPWAESRIDKVK